jgi:hypothetical protein
VIIDHVHVDPDTSIDNTIMFKPHGPSQADVAPDPALDCHEVQPEIALQRQHGWLIGCLYNQETAERPQRTSPTC